MVWATIDFAVLAREDELLFDLHTLVQQAICNHNLPHMIDFYEISRME